MFGLKSVLVLALCALSSALQTRQSSAVTCGSVRYTVAQLKAAAAEGCRLNAAGKTVGSNDYPHTFNNRENLPFPVSGSYQEFPILSSGNLYTGGSPGADRVAFVPKSGGTCTYAGAMTHTGASGNNFVICKTSSSVAFDDEIVSSAVDTSNSASATVKRSGAAPSAKGFGLAGAAVLPLMAGLALL